MTFESTEIIKVMLQHDGVYPGDPQMSSIWTYTHDMGQQLYAVFGGEQYNDLAVSPFVIDPVLLWSKEDGLTDAGRAWLAEV